MTARETTSVWRERVLAVMGTMLFAPRARDLHNDQGMNAQRSGSDLMADVVCPTPERATKTEPIAIEVDDAGPSHADLARFDALANQPSSAPPLVLSGRYRLLRRLGSGGMGVVYLAEQLDRGHHRVAIKILDASAREWCRRIDRFLWEARLCSRIRHPNVVTAYEYGSTPQGIVYMVMELLEGHDLKAILRERGRQAGGEAPLGPGRLSWRWTRYVMRQVCAGADALHRAGVVHRDLKASNCFYVRRNAAIKLIDLGIATFEDPLLTAPGMDDRTIVGTPEYMAPEQVRGTPVDRRADVYSAGVLLFELLTGRTPFRGRTTEEVFEQQLGQAPPRLEALDPELAAQLSVPLAVPRGIDEVLHRALAKHPRDRFADMPELAAALDSLA